MNRKSILLITAISVLVVITALFACDYGMRVSSGIYYESPANDGGIAVHTLLDFLKASMRYHATHWF